MNRRGPLAFSPADWFLTRARPPAHADDRAVTPDQSDANDPVSETQQMQPGFNRYTTFRLRLLRLRWFD
jgi:hypothetical protein